VKGIGQRFVFDWLRLNPFPALPPTHPGTRERRIQHRACIDQQNDAWSPQRARGQRAQRCTVHQSRSRGVRSATRGRNRHIILRPVLKSASMPTSISAYNEAQNFVYCMTETQPDKVRETDPVAPAGSHARYWLLQRRLAHSLQQLDGALMVLILTENRIATALDRGIDAKFCDPQRRPHPPSPIQPLTLFLPVKVIEHLIDTDGFLSEVVRVTKPHGHVIITTPNLASLKIAVRLLCGILSHVGELQSRWFRPRFAPITPRVLKKPDGRSRPASH